ncbi:50S ribosomal protein L21 [Candidatus Parcubacteria bacterium]|nr:50S ribosomal protein L21 [Candidatus Parcubacteria bacterium]
MAEATVATKPKAKRAPKAAPKAAKKAPEASNTAFAVISTGGKQYRVMEGQKLKIEKIPGDHKEGDAFVFKNILLKGNGDDLALGFPYITGSTVSATITQIGRYKTVDVIHYKQKSRYFKKYGHRQPYFEVRIDSIN